MLRLLWVVVLLCVTDIFCGAPECLQKAVWNSVGEGFSVLVLNFQKEDLFLNTEVSGTTKEIKFVSQKLHDGKAQRCTVIPDRENRVKCVEFRFEVFGKKYMVFAGVYKENGVYPRLIADFQKTRCLDGWDFDENKGKVCDRDEFQFVPQPRSCINEETFFIQAKIDEQHCVNHIFQRLHSKGLIGKAFDVRAWYNHREVKSPHNDPNIEVIGWEHWRNDDMQNLTASKCRRLQHNLFQNMRECHLLKLRIYGRPFQVLYWVYFNYALNVIANDNPETMQCQEGLDFNSDRFFPCREDPENGIYVETTPINNECTKSYPMIGVGAPRQKRH